ncbi:MAG: YeeE/YedE family protein [Candidatus Eisenbacteria bacterium]|nr:YeeE/YedE family protein [Candidatus Eisenbacteria bacterium]
MSTPLFLALGFLFGIGFGFFVQRAGFCVAHGLGEIFIGRAKRFTRLFLIVFAITSVGFLLSGRVNPALGLKTIGQIRGAGFYNILSGILFGMGILMTGGCILGTLRQLGEGNLNFLVVLASFAPGMALVVYGLNPLLEKGYNVQSLLLPDLLGVPAAYVTAALVVIAVAWYARVRPRKRRTALKAGAEASAEPRRESRAPVVARADAEERKTASGAGEELVASGSAKENE